jgi:PAS domain-containing protein
MWNTIRSGRPWHGRITNRRKDGTLYEDEMRIAAVRASDGIIVSYIAIKRDVTQSRADEEAHRFLAAIVESSDDAIIASTPAGVVLTWNRGAEILLGYAAGEMIGRHINTFVPPERWSRMADCTEQVSQGSIVSHYDGV